MTLVIPAFTISPPNTNFVIFYSTLVYDNNDNDNSTDLVIDPTPSWLTFNNITL